MVIISRNIKGLFSVGSPKEESIVEQALELYDLGFNVIPFYYGTKKPSLNWVELQRTRIPRYALEKECKGRNIGVITGIASRNLFVVDCDNEGLFYSMLEKLQKLDLAKWYYITSRGGHFWFLSENGIVENHKEGELEIWGNNHCILIPPSVNADTGVIYKWENREGELPPTMTAEDISHVFGEKIVIRQRMVNGIPPVAYEVLFERDTSNYISNSEAEIAATLSLVGCGFSNEQIEESFKIQLPEHFKNKKNPSEWLYNYYILPARKLNAKEPFQDKIDKLIEFSQSYSWNSRTGNTDKIVYLALCERARREGIVNFRASKRELSELTNISDKTVLVSCNRLIKLGLISKNKDYEDLRIHTNHYTLTTTFLDVPIKHTEMVKLNGVINQSIVNHDLWQPRAMGKPGLMVYMTLLQYPDGLSVSDLAKMNNRKAELHP